MKSKQQSPCSNCMQQPVMSWGNTCSTCMHKPMRCMHLPVMSQANALMSQADACTYCMGSKVSSLSWIYLYSSQFVFIPISFHRCLHKGQNVSGMDSSLFIARQLPLKKCHWKSVIDTMPLMRCHWWNAIEKNDIDAKSDETLLMKCHWWNASNNVIDKMLVIMLIMKCQW